VAVLFVEQLHVRVTASGCDAAVAAVDRAAFVDSVVRQSAAAGVTLTDDDVGVTVSCGAPAGTTVRRLTASIDLTVVVEVFGIAPAGVTAVRIHVAWRVCSAACNASLSLLSPLLLLLLLFLTAMHPS
jgi:hypothetical protein